MNKEKNMKKLLFVLPIAALLASCDIPFFKQEEEKLPEPEVKETEVLKSVKITADNNGLTTDDSTEAVQTSLDIEESDLKYTFEISANSYNHAKYKGEWVLKSNAYIKSVSTFKVDRLVIDYMSKQGFGFEVYAGETAVTAHESEVKTEFNGEKDFGAVVEYPINGNSWKINNTVGDKPGACFYSITVIFTMVK